MAEAGKGQVHLGLPEEASTQWPLQRYGRFMLSDVGEQLGPDAETEAASAPTWKVFDSNEESGYLVLTIVISGHFFISQGKTLLEGFSLVGSQNWLKIVRRMDCLLFGTTIKNKSRMFRVQFSGESRAQALEHCCSCVQNLAQYTVVQEPDGINKEAWRSPGPLRAGEGPGKDCVQKEGLQLREQVALSREGLSSSLSAHAGVNRLEMGLVSHRSPEQSIPADTQGWAPPIPAQSNRTSSMKPPEGRTSVAWLAESFLASEELPSVYTEQSAWNVEDIGPFLRLCLMDQNFPAFVEEVEKELKKLAGFKI